MIYRLAPAMGKTVVKCWSMRSAMTDANTSNTDDLRAAAKTLRLLAESISWWRSVKGGERPWVLDGDEAAALLTIWESVDKREAAKGKREWLIVRKWRYGKKHL